MSLDSLPNDVLIDIFGRSASLQDLRSMTQTSRALADAFYERRPLLLSIVLRREVVNSGKPPLQYVRRVIRPLRNLATRDAIIFYQAIDRFVARSGNERMFFEWCLELSSLYISLGRDVRSERTAALERVYTAMLALTAHFDPNIDEERAQPSAAQTGGAVPQRLPSICKTIVRELASEYTRQGRLEDRLALEQEMHRRLSLREADSLEWGERVVKTFRDLKSRARAIRFERNMYQICRTYNLPDHSLTWARHLVHDLQCLDRHDQAEAEQQRVLQDLRPGSGVYVGWARQLISIQRRNGRLDAALALKAEVWNTLNVSSPCFFGWAHELADDYRRHGRKQDALDVMRHMHEETIRDLQRYPRDQLKKFHSRLAAMALAAEYRCLGRDCEAAAVHQQWCAV